MSDLSIGHSWGLACTALLWGRPLLIRNINVCISTSSILASDCIFDLKRKRCKHNHYAHETDYCVAHFLKHAQQTYGCLRSVRALYTLHSISQCIARLVSVLGQCKQDNCIVLINTQTINALPGAHYKFSSVGAEFRPPLFKFCMHEPCMTYMNHCACMYMCM